MDYKITKMPQFINDDCLVKFNHYNLNLEKFLLLIENDKYLALKVKKFAQHDISPDGFEDFPDRASLRNLDSHQPITRTIYTAAVELAQGMSYETCLDTIKYNLDRLLNNRRLVLNFTNTLGEYLYTNDVSCLAYIQYVKFLNNLNVKIVYRASDIKDELFYDFMTLYYFFIMPLADKKSVNISFYSTTCQNIGIDELNTTCNKIMSLGE